MHTNTARNFALQLGALVSLYLSLSFLLVLLFGIINLMLPDAAESYWTVDSAQSSVRFGIAMVVVFFPTYLLLTRAVNKVRRSDKQGAYLTLTKWLIYLSLLVAGGALLGDVVAVIMTFLNGELTERFLLKALAVLVVIGPAFYYYLQDARGYWVTHERGSIIFGVTAGLVALLAVIAGFMYIDSPSEVREQRLDMRQVQDLQDMQWRIEDHAHMSGELPSSIDEVYNGIDVPTAPEGRGAYRYETTEDGFQLCATFARDAERTSEFAARPTMFQNERVIRNPEDWDYTAGEFCFKRTVNLDNARVLDSTQS